jgi:hypothetical protein
MVLSLVSKFCWSLRHISLGILNFANAVFFSNDYSSWVLHNFILALVVLLPLVACTLWCCLALEEWLMEEDERGFLRRVLQEAEEARLRELDERERKKNG